MQIVSWRVLIPMKSQGEPVLTLSFYFVAVWRGFGITHGDPFLRHSRQALACSSRWVRTAIGRRTTEFILLLILGTGLTLFYHQCLGTLRNTRPSSKGPGDYIRSNMHSYEQEEPLTMAQRPHVRELFSQHWHTCEDLGSEDCGVQWKDRIPQGWWVAGWPWMNDSISES